MYDLQKRLEITIDKVLNMNIFLTRIASHRIALLQKAFINPLLCGALFMIDGWMHFFGLQNLNPPFTAIIKLGRQPFLI